MALEQAATDKELIEATQNAVIETADSIAGLIETTAHDIHGQEAFYEHPTFWVAVSFVLVILVLGRPVGKLIKKMLEKRIENIISRISEAANLKDDAQKLLVEYERKFVNAEIEAGKILQRSQKEIELLKKENLDKLKNDMAIKEKEAENRLMATRNEAMSEIAGLTSRLTVNAVREAVAAKLSDQKQDELIEQSIAKIANLK